MRRNRPGPEVVAVCAALLVAAGAVACGGHGSSDGTIFPNVQPFSPNIQTTAANPLPLVVGQTATLTFQGATAFYITTWTMQVVYVPASPLCAVAIPGAPTGSAFIYSLAAAPNGSGQTATYPCVQQIQFFAFPSTSASAPGVATPAPQWSATVWVQVQPSPTPHP